MCLSYCLETDDTRNCLREKDSNSLFAREAPDMGYQDGAWIYYWFNSARCTYIVKHVYSCNNILRTWSNGLVIIF